MTLADEEFYAHYSPDIINEQLARYGVKFGIYKDGKFREQLFPFDMIPRVISRSEFSYLERGLKQRVLALNEFIRDIYSSRRIITDGVIAEEFVFSGNGYLAQCEGITPPKNIYAHISGIDLVQGKNGNWYVLEDNLRIPSGASYPMIARDLCRKSFPSMFGKYHAEDNRNYASLLYRTMNHVNTGGLTVILSPGRFNAAYFEHSYLAEKTGANLVTGEDLVVENEHLYFKDYSGRKERVGVVYRRISDEYLDPVNFSRDSLIGVPHIFEIYKKGNVALINTPGNGAADDKGIYYFVPAMIKYYLGEEPVLQNAPTYLPYYDDDMDYVLANFDDLVIKDVAESGGYGVVFGSKLTSEKKAEFISMIKSEPRRFIAQDVIDFIDIDIYDNGHVVPRKADLRAFVLMSDEPIVWKSGLTRFSRNPDSFIVNSSQGGGFKDTWVMTED
jgi:uncharacterized circularly permuted ATP-grasp superfamily protein